MRIFRGLIILVFILLIASILLFFNQIKEGASKPNILDEKRPDYHICNKQGASSPVVAGWYINLVDEDSKISFAKNLDILDEVSPCWYWVEEDCSIPDSWLEDPWVIQKARENGIKIIPLIGNGFDPVRTHKIIADAELKSNHIQRIISIVTSNNYDGIDIDYESLYSGDRDLFTSFMSDLARELHKRGKLVSVCLHAKNSEPGFWEGQKAQDWQALGKVVDRFRIMGYDYSTFTPGPIDPYEWAISVINFAKSQVESSKIYWGVPFYGGYDWNLDHPGLGVGRTWLEIQDLIKKYHSQVNWAEDYTSMFNLLWFKKETITTKQKWFRYNDGESEHEVWFADHESLSYRLDLVNELKISGICIWRLGSEDEQSWQVIKDKFADKTPPLISNIQIQKVNLNSVVIYWRTDEPSTSQVEYGESSSYGLSSEENNSLVYSHQVRLENLRPYAIYHFRIMSGDGKGNMGLSPDATFVTFIGSKGTNRISGDDRYKTAVEISRKGWANSQIVIIARGDNFPDALVGASLAGKYHAPILLTHPEILVSETKEEIKRLKAKQIIILGSEKAVSPQVVLEIIRNCGIEEKNIHRLGGENRYKTATLIAEKLKDNALSLGTSGNSSFAIKTAIVATGENFPDALSISSFSTFQIIPILLTDGKLESFQKWNEPVIKKLDIEKIIIVGDEEVVPAQIENLLKANKYNIIRLSGEDRYETSLGIVRYCLDSGMSKILVYMACGEDFPDGLCSSILASQNHSILLISKGSFLNKSVYDFLIQNIQGVYQFNLIGGSDVLSETVRYQLELFYMESKPDDSDI